MVVPFRFMVSLALMLGVSAPALADQAIEPASCKQRGAKRIVIGRFQITAGQLSAYKQAHPFAEQPPRAAGMAVARSPVKRANLAELLAVVNATPGSAQKTTVPNQGSHIDPWCGIVDDWHYSALAAYQQCNNPSAGSANAYFKADASYTGFNDALNHHALYKPAASLSQSDSDIVLEGDCYVCSTTRTVGPATTLPKDQIRLPTPVKGD